MEPTFSNTQNINSNENKEEKERYQPKSIEPTTIKTKEYLWDLNQQLFEVNKNIKVLISYMDLIYREMKDPNNVQDAKMSANLIGVIPTK